MTGIESRVEKDGKRLIEMEKYKLDLVELRDSIYNKQTNSLDYNRWNSAAKTYICKPILGQ